MEELQPVISEHLQTYQDKIRELSKKFTQKDTDKHYRKDLFEPVFFYGKEPFLKSVKEIVKTFKPASDKIIAGVKVVLESIIKDDTIDENKYSPEVIYA